MTFCIELDSIPHPFLDQSLHTVIMTLIMNTRGTAPWNRHVSEPHRQNQPTQLFSHDATALRHFKNTLELTTVFIYPPLSNNARIKTATCRNRHYRSSPTLTLEFQFAIYTCTCRRTHSTRAHDIEIHSCRSCAIISVTSTSVFFT